jgi:pimeloyl-ACP methyl ester carboxylesterase
LEKEEINKFIIIGYSIGAKIALNLFNVFPERVDKLLMIAPDGFRSNIWYKLATGTTLSRSVFRYVVKYPDFLFNFSDIMARLKLVNRGVIRFAKSQMSSQQKRDKVYYTWLCLRLMDVDKSKLKLNLKKYKVPIEIYLGSEDKIITEEHFRSFSNSTEIDCKVIVLPTGHTDLIVKTAEYLSLPGD